MEQNMKDFGKMINKRGKELRNGWMGLNIQEIT